MKQKLALVFLSMFLVPNFAQANYSHFTAQAKVISVRPIYEDIIISRPQKTCWIEERHQPVVDVKYRRSGLGGAIVGGVLGGTLGGALGRGRRGKHRSAVAGTAVGAIIGNSVVRGKPRYIQSTHVSEVEKCKVTHSSRKVRKVVEYDVIYRFRGREFQTRMAQAPGEKINLRVEISPIAY